MGKIISENLKKEFKEAILDSWKEKSEEFVLIKREDILKIFKYLKNELGFDMLIDLGGIDYEKKQKERFCVYYVLYSTKTTIKIIVKANIPHNDITIDSITSILLFYSCDKGKLLIMLFFQTLEIFFK